MEQECPGKTLYAACTSTPQLKITSTPPKHHSGTGCIDGIGCALGRIDPKGKQWIITYQRGRCVGPNWEWECKTDVPIILFAYVSTHPPWKKTGTHVKRGVIQHHDPTVYFPYDFISCQNEEGEVTEHTFTWPFYPEGEVFWWRCGGRTGGLFPRWSASRSPFWNAKCGAPSWDTELRCYAGYKMIRLIKSEAVGGDLPSDGLWKTNPADSSLLGDIFGNYYFHWPNWEIYRLLCKYDTTLIPVDATIVEVECHVRLKVPVLSNVPALFITMPTIDPWDTTEPKLHWNEPVLQGDIVYSVPNIYDSYTNLNLILNQAGIDHINKGGWTYFAWITQNDRLRASVPEGMINQQHAYLQSYVYDSWLDIKYLSAEP